MRRRVARWSRPFTVVAAMMISLASVWLLGVLNVRATSGLQSRQHVRTVVLRGPETQVATRQQREEETQPEQPEEEIMEIDLDMPLEPIDFEPLELETALPSPSVPPIEVARSSSPSDAVVSPRPRIEKTSKTYSANKVDQPPREHRSNPRPPYPGAKLQNGIEGTVTLKLLIDEQGEVEDVKVVSGDSEFVKAVMAVVFDWRFTPAQNRGNTVKVWGLKRVNFRLR